MSQNLAQPIHRQMLSHRGSSGAAGPLAPRFHPAPPPSASSTAAHLSPGSLGHCAAQPAALATTASIENKNKTRVYIILMYSSSY